MATFLRSTPILRTRKLHQCFACNEIISKRSKAVEWVSAGEGVVSSVYLHPECWQVTEDCCFSCKDCDDGEGFHERYLRESMDEGSECEGVKTWLEFQQR